MSVPKSTSDEKEITMTGFTMRPGPPPAGPGTEVEFTTSFSDAPEKGGVDIK
jgi:hypothetical protein